MHLLLIEDDLDLGRALQQSLHSEGYSSTWIRRAVDCPSLSDNAMFHCVLLDLSLPDRDGVELIREWRSQGSLLPIVVITAKSALDTRLKALNDGCDDYLIKPFATQELIARIGAVTRRIAQQASRMWTFGAMTINLQQHEVKVANNVIELTPREFQILLELARDFGSVVSKSSLSNRLTPLTGPLDFTAIEVHVSNLRKKIGADRVRTVRGVGYMLNDL